MSIIASSPENQRLRQLVILFVAWGFTVLGHGEAAIASPPELSPEARGCMPTERLPPLPIIRSDNTAKQLLADSDKIERIEIFDPVERRVVTTLVGRDRKILSAMSWFAETPEIQWIAQAQTIGRISRWRTVLLIYLEDHSQPFLAHPLSDSVLRLHRKHPYARGDVISQWRDPKTDVYVEDYHMWRLTDAFEAVRPFDDFCPTTIRMPDCELEQARQHVPVQPPRIRADNTASKLIAARRRITRVKIWSEWHRGVVGELSGAEVATLIEQLGATTGPASEWDGSPSSWDAVLLVYTQSNELPFAVHAMSHLPEILSRYLGPEDLRFERAREVQRRCHPHSGIGDDPWPDLPFARIEPADLTRNP